MKIFKPQFNFLANHKKLVYAALFAVIVLALLVAFLPFSGQAADDITVATDAKTGEVSYSGSGPLSWVVSIIANMMLGVIRLLAGLLIWLMNITAVIFEYNNFINARVVEVGWPLVRDLCNMFFVVILLIVAFSTILKVSTYHYKNILLKLVIMAILINFSKTILGFLIDFAQVLMLTFVNGFKDAMAINLSTAFGISNLMQFDKVTSGEISLISVFTSLILSLILVVVATFTMLVYIVVLLWRIITLWVLIVLSPIAFVGAAFPALKKYSSQFWEKFTSALTVGIALAFFMWLALTLLAVSGQGGNSTVVQEFKVGDVTKAGANLTAGKGTSISGAPSPSITTISRSENLFTFVVAIALLLMALQYAQQAGGFAGKFAGMASASLSKLGTAVAKAPFKVAKFAVNDRIDRLYEKTGIDLNMKRNVARIKAGYADKKESRLQKGGKKADTEVREGNFLTSRMAAATGGLQDHYRRYGTINGIARMAGLNLKLPSLRKGWKGLSPVQRGIMGKGAQAVSDETMEAAERSGKDAKTYDDLVKSGGSNTQYLKERKEEIKQDIGAKQARFAELEELEKRGVLTTEEAQEKTEIAGDLIKLKDEEIKVKIHLEAGQIDFAADDRTLDSQIAKFYDNFKKVDNNERDASSEISALEYQKKSITGFTPQDIDERKELDKQIEDKKTYLDKATAERKQLDNIRTTYGLNQYDDEKTMNASKLAAIRDQAQSVKTDKEKGITKMATDYRTNKLAKIRKRLEDPNALPEEKKALESQKRTLEIQSKAPAYLTKGGEEEKNLISQSDKLIKERDERTKKAAQLRPTVGYEGQRARRYAVAEEMEKIKHVSSDEELGNMYREAQLTENHARMAAILKKLANDGNFNEILKQFKYSQDYKGNKEFFEREVSGKGGYGEQDMLSLATDVSYINESKGWYDIARTTTMKNGIYQWLDEDQHGKIVTTETKKKGERSVVQLSRGAFGGEDVEGNYHISLTGKIELRQFAESWNNTPRLISEHMTADLSGNLLTAELKYGEITEALSGKKTPDGKNLAKEIIKLMKDKLGSLNNELESVDDSVNIIKSRMK